MILDILICNCYLRGKMKKPRTNITGQTFGHLYVTGMEYGGKKKGFVAVCNCLKCGKEGVKKTPCDIKSGHIKSCGCLAKYAKKDIVGQKFGYLEVVNLVREQVNCKNKKYKYFAICNCHNCGKVGFKVIKGNLIRGATTSCGCRRDQYEKITGKNNSRFTGYEDIRGKTWSTLKLRSKRRGHVFNLSIEDAWKLYEKQNKKCALTGLNIEFGKRNRETTASLDRLDINKGYEIGNVQWVHKHINIMRNVYPIDYFIHFCHLVAEKHKEN
jgi:hypothetical protein